MRAVIQRVLEASIKIEGHPMAQIGAGMLVLLGVEDGDSEIDLNWLVAKVANLRIFADAAGKMNLSAIECAADMMVVSQFTLHASTRKGNRPSFIRAAAPAVSEPLYDAFCASMDEQIQKPCIRGVFGADMKVALVNDGPVTICIDSRTRE